MHRSPFLAPTATRLQSLLDEGDATYFDRHPGERERRRFYFRGEQVLAGEPGRYITVTRREDGSLVRRFIAETVGDA